jgi:hypothetical protein
MLTVLRVSLLLLLLLPSPSESHCRYRPFWRIEEIKPYVAELAPPGVSLDQLLLRNARAVRAPQGETDAAGKPLMVYTWR